MDVCNKTVDHTTAAMGAVAIEEGAATKYSKECETLENAYQAAHLIFDAMDEVMAKEPRNLFLGKKRLICGPTSINRLQTNSGLILLCSYNYPHTLITPIGHWRISEPLIKEEICSKTQLELCKELMQTITGPLGLKLFHAAKPEERLPAAYYVTMLKEKELENSPEYKCEEDAFPKEKVDAIWNKFCDSNEGFLKRHTIKWTEEEKAAFKDLCL